MIYPELAITRESAPVFWQRPKAAEEWESFIEERKEGFRCALIGGCWPEEVVDGVTRSGPSYVIS